MAAVRRLDVGALGYLDRRADDFADLAVRAIRHAPTGPMAADYLAHLPPTGEKRGAAAYHDKRFALSAALEDFDTALYVDADSRIAALPPLGAFPPVSPYSRWCRRASENIWKHQGRGACRSSWSWRVDSLATPMRWRRALVPRGVHRCD